MARRVREQVDIPPTRKGALRRLLLMAWTSGKTVVKLALLLPLLLGMVWANYTIDRSGLFHGDRYKNEVALALIAGENLAGYDQMNERELYTLVAENITQPYDTIALGSSRVMPLRKEVVGGSFLNCGMSNADYRDVLSTYYLFDRAGMKPKNLILCVDPGLLYNDAGMLHPYSNKQLYDEFLALRLGIDTGFEAEPTTPPEYDALLDPSYFQGNLQYYFEDETSGQDPGIVQGPLEDQPSNVKMGDGSIWYAKSFREASLDVVNQRAEADIAWLARMDGYQNIDPELLHVFTRFLEYVQQQEINVVFLLVPFHPLCYNYAVEKYNAMTAMFKMEDWLREYAVTNNIPLYGNYNPFVGRGFMEENFYDGLHIRPEAMPEIFPGIKAAQAAVATGHATSPLKNGGLEVSPETAMHIITTREKIAPPQELRAMDDEMVDGYSSYVVGRYENSEETATLLARYAVAKQTGTMYRFDTNIGNWVIDPRFS